MKRLAKPVVALVAVLGLLSYLAAPSGATTGTITGGTLSVNLNPPLTTVLGAGGTGQDCGSNITATDSSTGALDSSTLTGTLAITLNSLFPFGSNWYKVTASSTGTYTSEHTEASQHEVTIHMNVTDGQMRNATAGNCASAGTAVVSLLRLTSCTLTGLASLTQAHPGPSGDLHLAGSCHVSAYGAVSPFSALHSKTASFASLTATLG